MEMMAMLPSLIGAAGGAMNMINGSPASRVQPGMNPMMSSALMFPAAAGQGYSQLAGMPNIYGDTLGQYGGVVGNLMNNPGAGGMIGGANDAASMGAGAAGNFAGLGNFLAQMGQGLTPWAGGLLNQGSVQNPNAGSYMDAARGGAALGAGAAGNYLGTGMGMQDMGRSFAPAAGTVLNQSFDPQNALHDRTAHNLQEGVRATNAAHGLNMSPFGAGVENKAMSDFNIDWQNNLLGRMTQGAQSAGNILGTSGNLMSGGAGLVGQAPGMFSSSGALPYQAGGTILSDILRNMTTGAQGAGMLLDQSGRDITGGASLMGQAPGLMSSSSMLPYQAFNTIGGNQLGALGQYGQYGMAATQQPQQQLQDFYQLLGLGNNSSQVGNNIFGNMLNQSNMNFNQSQQQGQNFGNALSGLGRGMSNPFASGGAGGSGNGSMFPSASFMSSGMGWG